MSKRLDAWISEQLDEVTEAELAADIDNGTTTLPPWAASGYTALGRCLWDMYESRGESHLYTLDDGRP